MISQLDATLWVSGIRIGPTETQFWISRIGNWSKIMFNNEVRISQNEIKF